MTSARKLHKKTVLICALLLALCLIVTLLMLHWRGTVELSDLNRHSATPAPLGKALEDASGYESVPGMMGGEQYMSSDGVSFITVAHFPDAVFGSTRVVGLRLVGESDAHILGVRVGDNATAAYRALEAHGYEVTHSGAGSIRAERGRITLQFTLDGNGRVTEIVARLSGTNLFRVQYKAG